MVRIVPVVPEIAGTTHQNRMSDGKQAASTGTAGRNGNETEQIAAVLETGQSGSGAGRPGGFDRLSDLVGGQVLPSPWYQTDDVQYFAPGPEFKCSREAAALKAYAAERVAAAVISRCPRQPPVGTPSV